MKSAESVDKMMKRRDFSLTLAAGACALGLPVRAQYKQPRAGTDFLVLTKPAPVQAPAGKIEVVEFFWYSCSHCNAFEPTLEAWIKRLPAALSFRRVPVGFNSSFAPQQRLYYALETLKLLEKLHRRVFAAIHVEKQNLSTPDAITNWVVKQGVDKAQFLAAFNSFSVANSANLATQLQNAYQVEGVPALGVAGRYYTDGALAGGMERALQVVDFLAAEARAGRKI
jgi:thiol:disulfide interchange protein DsbA